MERTGWPQTAPDPPSPAQTLVLLLTVSLLREQNRANKLQGEGRVSKYSDAEVEQTFLFEDKVRSEEKREGGPEERTSLVTKEG